MIVFSGRIHLGFAIIVWCMIQVGVEDVFLNPIPFLIGTLFPDSDHRKAFMGRLLPLWLFFRHRGFTHTWFGLALSSLPVAVFISVKWGLLFAAGYLLHLMLDATTPMGIKWFTGHKKRTYR